MSYNVIHPGRVYAQFLFPFPRFKEDLRRKKILDDDKVMMAVKAFERS